MPTCGAQFTAAPHPAWAKQGYVVQEHTCDENWGHSGPHVCRDEKDNAIAEGA